MLSTPFQPKSTPDRELQQPATSKRAREFQKKKKKRHVTTSGNRKACMCWTCWSWTLLVRWSSPVQSQGNLVGPYAD